MMSLPVRGHIAGCIGLLLRPISSAVLTLLSHPQNLPDPWTMPGPPLLVRNPLLP
jgi:hypothetical protein